ncbi:hypothetical protein NDU88_002524 [Pleurodeles waltl]|uniref:Uncharacterized protein n=1 Tax=Pleurodeles waltl TaxID=8319 RepID=A0AAV7U9I7_PLEWA|nr:hypothetical protein NDU88_002524 [Pleurodeles waltl]
MLLLKELLGEIKIMRQQQVEQAMVIKQQLGHIEEQQGLVTDHCDELEERVTYSEDKLEVTSEQSVRFKKEIKILCERQVQLENQSRRSKLRTVGVPEGNETSGRLTALVESLTESYVLPSPPRSGSGLNHHESP